MPTPRRLSLTSAGAVISPGYLIHGRRTQELSLARISERVGLVLQDPEAQLFNLLVRDELAWGLENRGLARAEIASRLASTLSFFRIEILQDRITYDLSGGEKQRVALAAVHAIAPAVYLFDHPTSQLDPIGAAEVVQDREAGSVCAERKYRAAIRAAASGDGSVESGAR